MTMSYRLYLEYPCQQLRPGRQESRGAGDSPEEAVGEQDGEQADERDARRAEGHEEHHGAVWRAGQRLRHVLVVGERPRHLPVSVGGTHVGHGTRGWQSGRWVNIQARYTGMNTCVRKRVRVIHQVDRNNKHRPL